MFLVSSKSSLPFIGRDTNNGVNPHPGPSPKGREWGFLKEKSDLF
jgi:hypothetical protein